MSSTYRPTRHIRLLLILLLLLLALATGVEQAVFMPREHRSGPAPATAVLLPVAGPPVAAPLHSWVGPPNDQVVVPDAVAVAARAVPTGPPAREAELAATVYPLVLAADAGKTWPLSDAAVKRSRAVKLDDRLLRQQTPLTPGARVQISPFPDVNETVVLDQVTTDINGVMSFTGHLLNQPQGTFVMSASSTGYIALLKDPVAGSEYELRWRNGEQTGYALEDDPTKRGPQWGGAESLPESLRTAASSATASAAAALPGSPPLVAVSDATPTTVDLMMVYDTTAATWAAANGGITTLAAQALARVNLALANSQVPLTIRLVFLGPANYTSVDLQTDLTRLSTLGDGYMDYPQLLTQTGADLVTLWVDTGSATGWIGQAWQLDSPSGDIATGFSDFDIEAVNTSTVMQHELMHNFGAGHSKTQTTQPGPGLFSYAAGYYFTGTNGHKYHTIMAYNFDGSGTIYEDCDYYSNPSVSYQGAATGVTNDADNHRCIINTMVAVAAYRSSTVNALVAGVPYNDTTASGNKTYVFDVPAGVYSVTIQTTNAPTDILDLGVNLPSTGSYPSTVASASKYSAGFTGNETVVFTSTTTPAVQAGRYYILAAQFGAGGTFTITATYTLLQPPVITGPAAGSLAVTPTFTWNAATGADHYELWVDDVTAHVSPVIHQTSLTGATYTSSVALTPGNACNAYMRTISVTGEMSAWSAAANVTVAVLGVPAPATPSGALSTVLPTFTWSAVTGATSYDVWINDLTTGETPVQRNPAVAGTSWTLTTPLVFGHNYAWAVRANGGGQVSAWSSGLSFAAPQLTIPTWGAPPNTNTDRPTLTWSDADPNVTAYDLWVADLTAGASPAQSVTNAVGTSWTPTTPLTYGHSYSVYIRAKAGTGASGWSTSLNFTIAAMGIPVWGAPANTNTSMPTLTWGAVTNATGYELWVANLTLGAYPEQHPINVVGTTWTPTTALHYGQSYRVYIRTLIGADASGWSSNLDFTIAALGTPVWGAPTNTTTNTPTLTWGAVANATSYELWVANLTLSAYPEQHLASVAGTTWTPATALHYGDSYQVYIRALAGSDAGAWSSALNVTVPALGPPVWGAPTNTNTSTPTLTWGAVANATGYELWVANLTLGAYPEQHLANVVGTIWTPSTALHFGHSYAVYIRALSSTEGGSWSSPLNFTIAALGTPVWGAPTNTTTNTPTLAWGAVANATGYEIWVANLTRGTYPEQYLTSVVGTTWTPATALHYGESYSVYMRAMAGTEAGGWSSALTFTITALGTPVWGATANASTSTPTFTWGAVANATGYELWAVNLTLGGVAEQHVANVAVPSWTPTTALHYGDSYQVWVRALAGSDAGAWSLPLALTIPALGVPVWGAPTGTNTTSPTLPWGAVTNAQFYDLYLMDLTSGANPAVRVTNVAGTSWTPTTPLTAHHNYRAYLRALAGTDAGGWSSNLDFSTP